MYAACKSGFNITLKIELFPSLPMETNFPATIQVIIATYLVRTEEIGCTLLVTCAIIGDGGVDTVCHLYCVGIKTCTCWM